MKTQDIVNAVKGHKGQHILATWQRIAKTYNGIEAVVEKRVKAYVRAGIDYANLASVKQAIENGERGEVEPLKWGQWIQFPFTIEHKGKEYVRLYPASFDNLKPTTQWLLNGKEVDYSTVEPMLQASEKKHDEHPACFTLFADSVISIG